MRFAATLVRVAGMLRIQVHVTHAHIVKAAPLVKPGLLDRVRKIIRARREDIDRVASQMS